MQLHPAHRSSIKRILAEAVETALEHFPVTEMTQDEADHLPETLLVSILGFSSDNMRGTLVLGCDEEFLKHSCPGLNGDEEDIKAYINDWIGELSNLIMGRVKNQLLPYGIAIRLNPPSISESSDSIFTSYSNSKPSETLWFGNDGGEAICTLIACDIDESVDLRESSTDDAALDPGSAIISLKEFPLENGATNKAEQKIPVDRRDVDLLHQDEIDLDSIEVDDEDLANMSDDEDSLELSDNDESDFDHPDEEDFSEESMANEGYEISDIDESIESSEKTRSSSLLSDTSESRSVHTGDFSAISSIRYLVDGSLEVTFGSSLVFMLDLEKLYGKGVRNFEMQGLPVELYDEGFGVQVTIDGIRVTVYRSGSGSQVA